MKKLFFIIIALFAIFVSCDEFDFISNFSVISVTPSNNAINIDVESSIIVKFNKTISKDQANFAGVILLNSKGEKVPTSIKIDENYLSIIIKPIENLNGNEIFELKVDNVLSEDGTTSKSFTSSFQTKSASIRLASCSILDGSTDIKNLSEIVLCFDREIQKTLYNYNAINLVDSKLKPVSGIDKIVSDDAKSVKIVFPEFLLDPGVSYMITVDEVKAEDGSSICNPNIKFTIKDEQFAIVSFTPINGSRDVALDAKIIVSFNKKIKGHGLPYFTIEGKCGETWSSTTDKFKTVTFTCDRLLTNGTTYSLVEFGNTESVTGEVLGTLPKYAFTTIQF